MIWKPLLVLAMLALPPILLRLAGRPRSGVLLGIPYNFELPTPTRLRQTLWNPSSDRLLAPHLYGWGYSLNFGALARRLGLVAA